MSNPTTGTCNFKLAEAHGVTLAYFDWVCSPPTRGDPVDHLTDLVEAQCSPPARGGSNRMGHNATVAAWSPPTRGNLYREDPLCIRQER